MNKKLSVKNLSTYFYTSQGVGKAVDDVSFDLYDGETVAIVGESGCGKSVTALSILNLINPPGKIVSGEIIFKGENILSFKESEMSKIRGGSIAMIFQDPMNSLNPVLTIGDQITETIQTHKNFSKKDSKTLSLDLLKRVKLNNVEKIFDSYPHQLSGGMIQRVMIAIALSCSPSILIADEPTTALDVSIQRSILDLLMEIKKESNLSIIFITHDFRIVKEIADNVIVMYAGKIVENRRKKNIFDDPKHPYTEALLKCMPPIDAHKDRLPQIKGNVKNIFSYSSEICRFYERCEQSADICKKMAPERIKLNDYEYFLCFDFKDNLSN